VVEQLCICSGYGWFSYKWNASVDLNGMSIESKWQRN